MSILVTGGAGFIGSNFVIRWLSHRDEQIINLDKLAYSGRKENLRDVSGKDNHVFVEGDIADRRLVTSILQKHQPRAVVHFAAESHVDRSISDPHGFVETNIFGSFHLLEAVRDFCGQLEDQQQQRFRFIHISTDEVFGSLEADEPAFHENSRYQPNSPYSASKAASDHLARACFHTFGLPVITTHCSNNYGPRQLPEKLIPLAIIRALQGETIPVYGDGKNIRDWLYVEDHCQAIEQVLAEGVPGEVYNIGGLNEKTNIDVIEILCDALDRKQPRQDMRSYREQISFVRDRPGHDRRYAIDTTKIETTIGWRPQHSFATGIEKTIDWYLDNQSWVEQVSGPEYQSWIAKHYQ